MKWIKDALLDVLIFGVIIAYLFTSNTTIEIVLWVYTSFLLVGKILYFFIDFLQTKATKTNVPDWFYHCVYLLSIILLILSKNYYLTAAWFIIWGLSIIPIVTKKKEISR